MPRRNNGPRLRWLEKRGGYYIVWTERGRSRERSAGTTDFEEAKVALAEFLQHQPGRAGPRDPSEILITDLLADHQLEQEETVRDPVRLACAVAALTPFWFGRTVQDITRQTCAAYAKSRARYFVRWDEDGEPRNRCAFTSDPNTARTVMAALIQARRALKLPDIAPQLERRPLSPGSVRRELTVLRAAVNAAHRDGKLTRAVTVDLPEAPAARQRFMTRDETARLLKAALAEPRVRLHLPLFILIGLYTGQRKEAILSLRWPAVDLRAGLMDFRRPGQKPTKKRRSHIKIPPPLLTHLRNARKRGTDLGHVVNEDGQPIGDIKRSFATACRRAGLADVTPHTLRHTCATWLMQQGIDKWEAAGFLAMSLDTLERVYGHHHPEHYSAAANAFSSRPRNVRVTGAPKRLSGALREVKT